MLEMKRESDYAETVEQLNHAVVLLDDAFDTENGDSPTQASSSAVAPNTEEALLKAVTNIEDSLWLPSDYERSLDFESDEMHPSTHHKIVSDVSFLGYVLESGYYDEIWPDNDPTIALLGKFNRLKMKIQAYR